MYKEAEQILMHAIFTCNRCTEHNDMTKPLLSEEKQFIIGQNSNHFISIALCKFTLVICVTNELLNNS